MEKTEMKTGGIVLTLDEAIKHCKENVQKETQNGNLQCAIEHNQLAIWLSQLEESKAKAAAYDRLMSGGKKTLKEIANFLGNPVAVDRDGRLLWSPKKPEIGLFTWIWYDKYLPKNIFDYTGDWKDSLTLPDRWEGTEGNQDRLNVWVCPKCGCETTTRGSIKGKVACIECGHVIHDEDE